MSVVSTLRKHLMVRMVRKTPVLQFPQAFKKDDENVLRPENEHARLIDASQARETMFGLSMTMFCESPRAGPTCCCKFGLYAVCVCGNH